MKPRSDHVEHRTPVRVAIVSSVHRWNDTRIYVKQAQSLRDAGFQVTLVAVSAKGETRAFQAEGVIVHPLPRRRPLMRWLNWLAILRVLIRTRPALIHGHDPELFPLISLARIAGCRVVCDVHEDVAEQISHKEWIPRPLRRPLSALARFGQRSLPHLVDAVILAEDSYRRNFPPSQNIFVVRNFPLVPSVFKTDYVSTNLKLVYVGDVRIVRGVETYVRVTHSLVASGVPATLRVVGSFAIREEEEHIRQLIGRLGLNERVQLMGRQPPAALPSLICDCDVGLALLYPIGNYRESYPTKMFEYMGCGLPVVASDFELWANVLVPNDCGRVVDPLDVQRITEILSEYWRAPDVRRRQGTNGRRAVVDQYNWNVDLPTLLGVYEAITGAAMTVPQ